MPTDQALLEAARAGDESAFAVLYRKHVDAARREACRRSHRRSYQDDAVAMAFASVFRAIANGAGPDRNFAAYLKTAVRNAVISLALGPGENWAQLDDVEFADDSPAAAETEAVSSMMSAALLALNNRQRRALWATEVEGCSNSDVARELDLTENAFAALKMRARKSLSAAYACQIVGEVDTCGWVASRIEDFVAGALGYSHRLVVDTHVEDCEACASLVPERDRSRRGVFALPLLLCAPRLRSQLRGPTGAVAGNGIRMSATRVAVVLAGAAGLSAGTLLLWTHGGDSNASSARSSIGTELSVISETAEVTARDDHLSSGLLDPADGEENADSDVVFPTLTRDDGSDLSASGGSHGRDDRHGVRPPAADASPATGDWSPGAALGAGQHAPPPAQATVGGPIATDPGSPLLDDSGHGPDDDTTPTTSAPSATTLTTPAPTWPASTTPAPTTPASATTTTTTTTSAPATTTSTVALWVGVVVVPTTSVAPWIGGAHTTPTTVAPFSVAINSATTTSSP